nr:Uncharacterised protein [Klebsiella pneumoniae]
MKQESIPAQSNSVNLFSVAPPTFIIQLMESMLPGGRRFGTVAGYGKSHDVGADQCPVL